MADKKKPQLGSASIIPPNRTVDVDTQTEESPPGGSPPNVIKGVEYKVSEPPQPPARTTTASPAYPKRPTRPSLAEGKEYRITLPSGKWVTVNSETDAKKIAIEYYGRNYPTSVIFEVLQPQSQAQAQPSTNQLARTKTRTVESPSLPTPTYLPSDQKRLQLYSQVAKRLEGNESAQALYQREENRARRNYQQRHGPIPVKEIPTAAKMLSEIKKYIYQGYAEYYAGVQKQVREKATGKSAREEAAMLAAHSQDAQICALRYGMSVLADLHQGLNLATWDFFFNALGPLGEVLEQFHGKEITWNLNYYGGRAWWSPYRIDYLIKTLPEEKTVDFILDASKETLYLIGKITPFKTFVKEYDRYGRPLSRGPVFAPLIKIQKGVSGVADRLEALGTEMPILQLQQQLEDIEERLFREQATSLPLKSAIDALTKQRNITLERITAHEKYFNKQWFRPLFSLWSKNKAEQKISVDVLRARIFRTFFPKKFLRKVKEPKRDFLSWIAVIIGQYIWEVTVGNIIRAIVEKVTSSATWARLSRALSSSLRMGANSAKEFLKAGPSLNTAAGTYLGYDWGGTIGRSVANALGADPVLGEIIGRLVGTPAGLVTGWTYQWVLNLSNNRTIVGWVREFNELSKDYKTVLRNYQDYVKRYGQNDPFVKEYLKEVRNLETKLNQTAGPLNRPGFFTTRPGYFTRFANWLNSPWGWGRFFRIPLKGMAFSSIIEQLRLAGLEVPSWYEPWMPPLTQYLWEIKGALFDGLTGFLRGGLSWSWRHLAFSRVTTVTLNNVQLETFREYMAAERSIIRVSKQIGIDAAGRPIYRVTIGTYNSFFTRLNELYRTLFRSPLNTLNRMGTAFSRTGLGRFLRGWWGNILNPGFFIGLELAQLMGWPLWAYIPAALAGGGLYALAVLALPRLLGILGGAFSLTSAGFSFFMSTVSLGGLIGWGVGTLVETIWGIPQAGLWGTIIGSVAGFALAYLSTVGIGWASSILGFAGTVGGVVGSAFTGILTGLGVSASWAGLVFVGSVASVATLTIFTVIIIGSAFWIPFSERLEGVTSSSMCFDINQPTFNGLPQFTFTPGERKEVCWETKNKTEYYQGALKEVKALDPRKDFTFHGYKFTITTPDGKSVVFEGDRGTGVSGILKDEYTLKFTPPSTLKPGDLITFDEYIFELLPPKDTGGGYSKILLKQFEEYARNIAQGNVSDYEDNSKKLIALTVVQGANNDAVKKYLLEEQIKLLEAIKKTPPASQDELNKLIDDEKIRIKNNINNGYKNYMTGRIAQLSGDPNVLKTINDCAGKTDPLCSSIDSYSLPSHLLGAIDSSFDPYRSVSPDQIDQEIKILKNSLKQIDASNQSVLSTINQIREIKNLLTSYGYNTPEFNKELERLAQSESSGIELYYLPTDTIIKVCLDVTYTGDGTTTASARETDSAVVPVLGQLVTTSSCQAELITPINQTGPSSIIKPVPGSAVSQGYVHGRGGHDGVDFAAPMGTNILAAAPGTVIAAGFENNGFGRYLIIQGDDGFYYLYAHMGSRVDPNVPYYAPGITIGSKVSAGEVIAYIGNTGGASGPHLHFGISTTPDLKSFYNQNESTTINPCLYIAGGCK